MLVSFTDGLQRINSGGLTYVTCEGQRLYVSSMARYGNSIYAGTFNNGLFVIRGSTVNQVETGDNYRPDAIVRLKCCNKHI
jgi:hypothetical protein